MRLPCFESTASQKLNHILNLIAFCTIFFSYSTVSANLHFSSSNRFSNMVTRILILITSVSNNIKKVKDGGWFIMDG